MTMPVSFLNLSADAVVSDQPLLLNSVLLLTSTTGGDVTLYEGQDATSGRKIATLEATANNTLFVVFAHAPFLARGLYVDVGSNVTEVTVFFTLLPMGAVAPPE
jgi:hypothetical protein